MFEESAAKKPEVGTQAGESTSSADVVMGSDAPPSHLFLIPVAHTTLFPGMVVPLILPEGKLAKTAEHVLENGGYVGVVFQNPLGKPKGSTHEFSRYGVAAKILKKINLPDNQVSVLLAGVHRFEIGTLEKRDPYFEASVKYLFEEVRRDTELEALLRSSLSQFKNIAKDNPLISEEVKVALVNIDGPGKLADVMASVLVRDAEDYQTMLSLSNVKGRLHHLLLLLKKEQDVQSVQKKIQEDINTKISSAQREFYLSEQLKVIQKELGGYQDTRSRLMDKFQERLKTRKLPDEVKVRLEEEMQRLGVLHEHSSEFAVCLNYLDWTTSLPWGIRTPERMDLDRAAKILDEDHHGLKEVKQRILEFLAVRKLKKSSEGSILCFVGAPGTGKTSLGKSIARALDRKFFRFSVGGMRDEAEIKGHRRTYVGAMPGKLIQGLKRVGAQNPVFLIDEVDKIGTGWASGGDPASALLELLDPEQNTEFHDHYVDLPYNCSEVLFLTTANTLDTIPAPLLDRMEIIQLHGYTESEKLQIAKKHLVPKQLEKHALPRGTLRFTDKALKHLITNYAREAGVRNLEKCIARICRKVAYKVVRGRVKKVVIDRPEIVGKYLGLPTFSPEKALASVPGVATGLAWTSSGGEVLSVESVSVEGGKGGFTLTGQLGEVMQESANIAYTFVRNHTDRLNLGKRFFDKNILHLHVPAGATPKDGPSAGITMAASLYSLLSHKPLKAGLAMTGELTLSGRVLPVGGIKEKLLAAKRMGFRTVIVPSENARDLKELEPELRKGLKVLKVSSMEECLRHLF